MQMTETNSIPIETLAEEMYSWWPSAREKRI